MKTHNRKGFTRLTAIILAAVCLLGVIVFREWADRERQRKAEECLASHAVKWDRTVNLPIAPHGDKLTDVAIPKKCLFAEISIRDEKGALLPVPKASLEGESLSVEKDEIRDGNMIGALKRLTVKTLPGRDEFSVIVAWQASSTGLPSVGYGISQLSLVRAAILAIRS